MGRSAGALACLFAVAAAWPVAAQDGWQSGGWTVEAEDFGSGERGCVATAPGTGDPLFNFTLIGGDFIVTLLSSRIDWRAGQTVSATLAIDSGWSRRMQVAADFPSLLFFEFPASDEFVERLRAGRVFRIDTSRGPYKLDLRGSAAALAALWACDGRGSPPGAAAIETAALPPGIIEFPAGSWRGIADLGDGSDLPLCTVYGPEVGSAMLLNWSPSGLSIGLQDDQWVLTDGARYPVTVSVDDRWQAELDAQALSENAVAIVVGDDPTAIDGLRQGNRLVIQAAQQEFRFALRGSNAAIGALRDCYRRYAGAYADLPAIPPPDSASPAPESPPATATAPRGPELAPGVYRRAPSIGLGDIEGLVRAQISPAAQVWLNDRSPAFFEYRGERSFRGDGPVSGQVYELDVPSGLVERAMLSLYAHWLDLCGRDGESGQLPAESFTDFDLQYAVIRCGTGPEDRQIELVLMLIDTYGVLYVIDGVNTDTYRMADLVLSMQAAGRDGGE